MATGQAVTKVEDPNEQMSQSKLQDLLQAHEEGKEVDTFELGRMLSKAFNDNGRHECDMSLEGAEGFLQNYISCEKNPGHKGFMPFKEFVRKDYTDESIPIGFQYADMFDYIKYAGNLTVNLRIRHVSSTRTEQQKLDIGVTTGKKILRSGTGVVVFVSKRVKANDGTHHIMSHACKSIVKDWDEWFEIHIATVSHVIFDQSEANKTTVQFSIFTDENEEKQYSTSGGRFSTAPTLRASDEDPSLLICYSRDLELLSLLNTALHKRRNYGRPTLSLIDKLSLPIISHPHGQEKQVSFGKFSVTFGKKMQLSYHYPVDYNTPTCKGSSGALIAPGWNRKHYLHEGKKVKGNLSNYSCWPLGKSEDPWYRLIPLYSSIFDDNQLTPGYLTFPENFRLPRWVL